MPFLGTKNPLFYRISATNALNYLPRSQLRAFLHSPSSKPWYVDQDEDESSSRAATSMDCRPKTPISPPPKDSPAHLARAYHFLSTSPLIDHSTLSIGRPLPAEAHPEGNLPLPMLKSVRKARRNRNLLGYGEGVGEGQGQGVYNWQLIAQVLEGTESRGAIEVISRSLREMLKHDFPLLPVPSKRIQRERKDGWAMLDIGDSIIHVCSRRAWQTWLDPTRRW